MRKIGFIVALLVAVAAVCLPASAAIGPDITVPVGGNLFLPNDLTYRTEIMITNHRDAVQFVEIQMVQDGHSLPFRGFTMGPRETKFLADGGFGTGGGLSSNVGAMRYRTYLPLPLDDLHQEIEDPLGQIEVQAFIVADRGRFASRGSTRQEIEAIPSNEYTAREATFVGVRHDLPTYTNVGVVNLHPTQTETFYVQFQHMDAIAVVVPPLTSRQIRIPGDGNAGRWVRVYPEWSITDGEPARTTPWVAYASTVDGYTGDAFSGIRVPVTTTFD